MEEDCDEVVSVPEPKIEIDTKQEVCMLRLGHLTILDWADETTKELEQITANND